LGNVGFCLALSPPPSNTHYVPSDLLHALSLPATYMNARLAAFSCLTFILLLHGMSVSWGLRIQNGLGFLKLVVLFCISVTGILCLIGFGGFKVRDGYKKPDNFRWDIFWEGSRWKEPNAFVHGLHNAYWYVTTLNFQA